MKTLGTLFCTLLCVMLMTSMAWGQTTVTWNFGTTAGNASPSSGTPVTNLTISDISIGNTLGTVTMLSTTSASTGYTGASGQYNAGNAARVGSLVTVASGSAYFEFTLTPASGYTVTLSEISFGTRSTSTAPQAYTLRYSTDSYGSDLATGSISNNTTWALKSNTGLNIVSSSGTAVTFRIYGYNGTGTPSSGAINWRIDDLSLTVTVNSASSPMISISSNTLSGFSYGEGSGPSSSQSYNLSGANLSPASGDLTVTGSTNYEVSTDNSSFASSKTVSYTGGTLTSTPIYVRLKAGLSAGSYNSETIANSGGGATSVNVTCNGNVVAGEPTNHPTLFNASLGTPPHGKVILTWTDASGGILPDGYLIKASTVSFADISNPVDAIAESDVLLKRNTAQGVQTASFGDLNGGTTYYFKIFPYKGSGSSINYKTDGSVQQLSIATDALYSTLLLEHNFDYSGNIAEFGWSLHSGSGSPINTTTGLTYEGYPSSGIGNAANVIGTGDDLNLGFAEQSTNGTSIYLSALLKVTESADNLSGGYFLHLGDRTNPTSFTSFCARVWAKVDASGNVNFGLSNYSSTVATYSSTNYLKNTTYLLILKYTINTTGDDEVKMWIKSSGVPNNEAEAGTPDITITDAGQNIVDAVAIRQASSIPDIVVDGIRIATSWGQAPLPVEVKSISTVASKYSAMLTWKVGTEVNAYGYEILRREVGSKEVISVGFVRAEGLYDYSFNDVNVKPGRYIYEIKQIDNDGTFTIYSAQQITIGEAAREFTLSGYPNPFNPVTNIEFTLPENGFATLKVYNLIGQEVATLFSGNVEAGIYNKVSFNASNLSSGMYFSVLEANNQRLVKKLMLTK